jgi:hypothetical protein
MTSTLQPESKSSSRRALLAGALGGLGAWAASAIGRASPVQAADGDPMLVGNAHTASSVTRITNSTNTSDVLWGESTAGGIGVRGSSNSTFGVWGTSSSSTAILGSSTSYIGVVGGSQATNQPGVLGRSFGNSTGVYGASEGGSLPAAKAKTGVYGYAAQDNASQGVWGHSPAGNGVVGSTTTGYAGYFSGKVYSTAFYELSEIGTPAAPAPNRARLFVKDNGAGKTQLCVRFHTGAVKVITTEP